jgi:hypothetical protein
VEVLNNLHWAQRYLAYPSSKTWLLFNIFVVLLLGLHTTIWEKYFTKKLDKYGNFNLNCLHLSRKIIGFQENRHLLAENWQKIAQK